MLGSKTGDKKLIYALHPLPGFMAARRYRRGVCVQGKKKQE